MRWHKDYELECKICHRKFIAHSSIAYYCPDCKVKVIKLTAQERAKAQQARETLTKEIKQKKTAKLKDIVMEADKHKMTYGQYVAMTEVLDDLY